MTKLTKEQRARLMEVHRAGGLDASRALATTLGVSRNYGAQLCRSAGDKPKREARNRSAKDPRWAWAIERGGILV